MIISPVILIVACYGIVEPYGRYVVPASSQPHIRAGLVLGAGVSHGDQPKPYKELQARLDVAADALQAGKVDKLLLSGDNRFKDYDEPTAMKAYLTSVRHIPADKLQADYAGRSTYESCERAARIFGLQGQPVVIFSAGSHLPRAIYLCRHFGITASGVSSGVEATNSRRREALARVKAVYNLYIYGERTVLGSKISF